MILFKKSRKTRPKGGCARSAHPPLGCRRRRRPVFLIFNTKSLQICRFLGRFFSGQYSRGPNTDQPLTIGPVAQVLIPWAAMLWPTERQDPRSMDSPDRSFFHSNLISFSSAIMKCNRSSWTLAPKMDLHPSKNRSKHGP